MAALLMRITQVKRVLVAQRENPIVNRLNKTKVEQKPDFKQEKDDRLKELRKKEQAATQQRVRSPDTETSIMALLLTNNSGRMRPSKLRSGRRKSGRRTTHMMICSRRKTWRPRATRTATRIGKMISCSHKSFNYWRRAAPQKEVITKVVIQHPIS